MSMTGGISFFDKNVAAFHTGATIAASSNNDDARYTLSTDRAFRWQSVGSDDATQETLTLTLSSPMAFSRLFLIGHNFKSFTLQYGSSNNFTSVKSINGALPSIAETDYGHDTAYYEFDPVTTDILTITIDTTQEVDAEKVLEQIILTNEIGTFEKWPDVRSFSLDPNETRQKNAAGGQRILKQRETAELSIDMSHYPSEADSNLIDTLRRRFDPFLVWMNGGKPSQFKRQLEGWRLRDIYLMQTRGKQKNGYYKNTYSLSIDKKIKLEEVDR